MPLLHLRSEGIYFVSLIWHLFNNVRAWKNLACLWWRYIVSPPSCPARHTIFPKNAQNSPISGWNPLKTDRKRHKSRSKIPLRSSNRWHNRWVGFCHRWHFWHPFRRDSRFCSKMSGTLQAVYFAVHPCYLSTTIKKNTSGKIIIRSNPDCSRLLSRFSLSFFRSSGVICSISFRVGSRPLLELW